MQLFACPFPTDTRPSREEDALPIAVSAELAVLLPRTATLVGAQLRSYALLGSGGALLLHCRLVPSCADVGAVRGSASLSMKRAKRASLTLLYVGLGALGTVKKTRSPEVAVVHALTTTREQSAAGSVGRALFPTRNGDADEPDRAAVRRRLRRDEQGTYIAEILQQRDSSLARWPDRGERPLTVWVQPTAAIDDWMPGYVDRVREAFEEWQAVTIPLGFVFVEDSAEAEVHVNWIDHFSEPISGRTKWARDDEWLITDANIILAVHHHQGEVLDEEAMRAMALHEIGHLLGLDHTQDATSIMAPKVRVRDLSAADRATVRLLYSLPPGPVR